MAAGYIILTIICIWTAFILLLFGAAIYRGNVELIAGYDQTKSRIKQILQNG